MLNLGCSNPSAVQVETTDRIPYNQTGQVVHLNSCFGFICLNKEQKGGLCLNYRIRQCCPVEEITTELFQATTTYETVDETTTFEMGPLSTTKIIEPTTEAVNNFVYNICAGYAQLINCESGYIFVNQAFYGVSTNSNVTCTYRY